MRLHCGYAILVEVVINLKFKLNKKNRTLTHTPTQPAHKCIGKSTYTTYTHADEHIYINEHIYLNTTHAHTLTDTHHTHVHTPDIQKHTLTCGRRGVSSGSVVVEV